MRRRRSTRRRRRSSGSTAPRRSRVDRRTRKRAALAALFLFVSLCRQVRASIAVGMRAAPPLAKLRCFIEAPPARDRVRPRIGRPKGGRHVELSSPRGLAAGRAAVASFRSGFGRRPRAAEHLHRARRVAGRHRALAARLQLRSPSALAGGDAVGAVLHRRRDLRVDRPMDGPRPLEHRRADARRRARQHLLRRAADDRGATWPRRPRTGPGHRSARVLPRAQHRRRVRCGALRLRQAGERSRDGPPGRAVPAVRRDGRGARAARRPPAAGRRQGARAARRHAGAARAGFGRAPAPGRHAPAARARPGPRARVQAHRLPRTGDRRAADRSSRLRRDDRTSR